VLADVVDDADVRVVERLQRRVATEAGVLGLVDHTHPPPPRFSTIR
jgi:hypothetical protein